MPVCPNCNRQLKKRKSSDGIIDACPSCKGQAVGLGVLRRLNVAPGMITAIWQKVMELDVFGNRQCPHCGKTMSQISKSFDEKMMTLDICKRCQVFWFDPNELEALPIQEILPTSEDDELSEKARLALARLKISERSKQNSDLEEVTRIGSWVDIIFIMIRNFIRSS
ncbi:MAG: zf-TFIIB domain-containing protein [candidate division Zixibacteria bacterium]|nr:zf-TFIIB domain-containing protein [candidate division Zixibacteria bacterium]